MQAEELLSWLEGQLGEAELLGAARVLGLRRGELLLAVLRDARSRLKLLQRAQGTRATLVLVSSRALEEDVMSARLGELAAGLLLLPYTALLNAEFLSRLEGSYRRRAVLEELADLYATYGPLACEFWLDEEYFYFKRLRLLLELNPLLSGLEFSPGEIRRGAEGFSAILNALAEEGLLSRQGDHYRLAAPGQEGRLQPLLRGLRRSLARYVAYGSLLWGGSALNRSRAEQADQLRAMPELEVPERLLRVEGCALTFEEDWRRGALRVLGHERANLEVKRLGPLSSRELWLLDGAKGGTKMSAKIYGGIYAAKWTVVSTWTLLSRRFSLSPSARLYKEFRALRELARQGIATPVPLALAPRVPALVTSYVEGRTLDEELQAYFAGNGGLEGIEEAARLLARIHELGWCLGDTKPDNLVLAEDGRLYLVDLEQAEKGGEAGWDLALFICFASRFNPSASKVEEMAARFLSAYLEKGRREAVRGALRAAYLNIFLPLLLPQTVLALKRALKRALERARA